MHVVVSLLFSVFCLHDMFVEFLFFTYFVTSCRPRFGLIIGTLVVELTPFNNIRVVMWSCKNKIK